jgi:hypothetical protein
MVELSQGDRRRDEQNELKAILSSEVFSRSSHLESILRYVCDRHWNGKSEEVKEYNLAVEALGRPPDFDPTLNPIVRVEMHRLREKLKKYYTSEGSHHPIMLTFQAGNYIPRFVRRPEDSPPPEPADAGPGQNRETAEPSAPAGTPDEGEAPVPASEENLRLLPGANGKHGLGWLPYALLVGSALALAVVLLMFRSHQASALRATPPAPSAAVPAPPPGDAPIRIISGYSKERYVASSGAEFEGDRFFKGGNPSGPILRFIARTRDPTLYAYGRTGDFSYDIPLKPVPHNLWLYFAELVEGPGTIGGEGGEARNLLNVELNGRMLLPMFDAYADARGNLIADARVFKDVEPAADGQLHLRVTAAEGRACLKGLSVIPSVRGKMNPIRLVAQSSTYTDLAGHVWDPDDYFMGGRLTVRQTGVRGTPDPYLYAGERWGAFDYAIPVAEGKYALTLYFAETYFGFLGPGGVGSRVFDVYCNGQQLLKAFDIYKEAGGANRALKRSFHGLRPNPQGKITLTFVPATNYACVNAMELVDESE